MRGKWAVIYHNQPNSRAGISTQGIPGSPWGGPWDSSRGLARPQPLGPTKKEVKLGNVEGARPHTK